MSDAKFFCQMTDCEYRIPILKSPLHNKFSEVELWNLYFQTSHILGDYFWLLQECKQNHCHVQKYKPQNLTSKTGGCNGDFRIYN